MEAPVYQFLAEREGTEKEVVPGRRAVQLFGTVFALQVSAQRSTPSSEKKLVAELPAGTADHRQRHFLTRYRY